MSILEQLLADNLLQVMSIGLQALDDRVRDRSVSREEATEQLDRIERSVEKVSVPASFAASAYTLRLHIDFLRRRVDGISVPDDSSAAVASE